MNKVILQLRQAGVFPLRLIFLSLLRCVYKVLQCKDYLPQEGTLPLYSQPNSRSYQIDHQTLYSSPVLVAIENMDNLERDIRRMGETPPSQIFWHNQATSQRQYHSPLPEQVSFARQQDVYSNYHSDSNAGFWNACIYGFGLTQNTPPDDCSSLSSLGWSSQHSTVDSYGSRNTSYSHPGTTGSGSIDPRLIKGGR